MSINRFNENNHNVLIPSDNLSKDEEEKVYDDTVDAIVLNWHTEPKSSLFSIDKEKELIDALQAVKMDDFIQTKIRWQHLNKLCTQYPELDPVKKQNYFIALGLTDPLFHFIKLYASYFYQDEVENEHTLKKFRSFLSENMLHIGFTKFLLLEELLTDRAVIKCPIVKSIINTVRFVKEYHKKNNSNNQDFSIQQTAYSVIFVDMENDKCKNREYHLDQSKVNKLPNDFQKKYRTIEDLEKEFNEKIMKDKISFIPLLFQLDDEEELAIKNLKKQYVNSLTYQCETEKKESNKLEIWNQSVNSKLVNCHRDFGFFGLKKTRTLQSVESILKQNKINPDLK